MHNSQIISDMGFYVAFSLVDITKSNCHNPKGFTQEYQQSQNLNTLIQTLGMRSQITIIDVEVLYNQSMKDYKFGSEYTDTQTIWKLKFSSDRHDAWDRAATKLFYAYKDCHLTPIHTELSETASIKSTFITTNTPTRNLYFENVIL